MEGVRGELLEAQRKLDQANSRVEYILNAIHDGLWEDNFKTGEFNFSDKMFTMLGYHPVAGREGFNFLMSKVHPDDMSIMNKELERLVAGEETTWIRTFRMLDSDGRWRHILSRGNCVARDEQGQGYHFVGVHTDITSQKLAEDALRESEEKHRTLVKGLPDIVMRFDRNILPLFVSDNIESMTGIPASRFYGESCREMGFPEDARLFWEEQIRKTFDTGEARETEFSFDKDGKELIFNWRLIPERDAEGVIRSVLSISRNITAHRKIEKDYKTLFNEMLDGFSLHEIICDDQGRPVDYRFLAVNPAFERMTGFPAEKVVGRTLLDLMPNTEHHWIETYGKVALSGEPTFFENYSGEVGRHFEVTAFRPAPNQFACIFSDVTKRKEAEQEIIRQSRVLAAINTVFHDTLDAVSEEEVAGICLKVACELTESPFGFIGELDRQGLFNLLAMKGNAHTGQSAPEAHPMEHLSGLELHGVWGRVLQSGRGFFTNDLVSSPEKAGLPENHPEIKAFLGVPLFRGNQVFGTLVVANTPSGYTEACQQDLEALSFAFTESLNRWRTQRAIVDNERTLTSLFNAINEAVCLLETTGKILAVNDTFARRVGKSIEECVGQPIYSLIDPELAESRKAFMNEIIRTGKPGSSIDQRNGRWIHHSVWPARDPDGSVDRLAIFATDITDIRKAEEDKEKLQAQLNQAQKMESVGRLAGGVAHDFNNMMGVILGHTEMILYGADSSLPFYQDLQEIQKAAQRSAALTKQLLAFARKQTVAPRMLDLNETVEGMLKMLRRIIGEDIDLAWIPGKKLAHVMVDPGQIDQILVNLCVNARDALGDRGKVSIETSMAAFDQAFCDNHPEYLPGEYVMLAVNDNGCGMDQETLARLFEPFFTTKDVGKGTGLGLSTVYGIVKQNLGFIIVESEKGQETAFRIYLPRYIPKTEKAALPEEIKPVEPGHETILLVEDEPAILSMTAAMLNRLGYHVLAVSTPGEAMRVAEGHPSEIHMLMTDVVMPEMNGRDLAKNLLALNPHMRRLFMSGYTADVIAHHGVLDKGVNFIQKPFTMKILAEKIREIFDQET